MLIFQIKTDEKSSLVDGVDSRLLVWATLYFGHVARLSLTKDNWTEAMEQPPPPTDWRRRRGQPANTRLLTIEEYFTTVFWHTCLDRMKGVKLSTRQRSYE